MPGDMRAAHGAGIGLGVKSSIGWIEIFRLAVSAHWKDLHGGLWPVIGNGFYDSKTRAAVRTVYERVMKTAIMGIEQLPEAIIAEGNIRRDGGVAGTPRNACNDVEGSELDR